MSIKTLSALAGAGALLAFRRVARHQSSSAAVVAFRNATAANEASSPNLVLHLYDHCPYCIRVELVLGWHGIPYSRKVYGYGDMDGPKKVHPDAKKALPVLECKAPGGGDSLFMAESGDIIDLVESGTGKAVLSAKTGRKDLADFLDTKGDFKVLQRKLTRPRIIKTKTADWKDGADVQYAKNKYEKQGFSYEEAVKTDPENQKAMTALLETLGNGILKSDNALAARYVYIT